MKPRVVLIWLSILLLGGLYLTRAFWFDPGAVRLPEPNDDWDNVLLLLEVQREAVLSGQLPLWNPYPEGGAPLLANPESSVASPLLWILIGLPVQLQLKVWIVVHALVGLWAFFRLAGLRGWTPQAASYGALTYVGASLFAERMHVGHLMWTGMAWLPFMMAAGIEPTPKRLKEAAAALTLIFLGGGHYVALFGATALVVMRMAEQLEHDLRTRISLGLLILGMLAAHTLHPGIAGLVLLICLGVLLIPRPSALVRELRAVGTVALWCVGLSAVKLLPALELLLYSSRFRGAEQEPVAALTLSDALLKHIGWFDRDPVAPHEDQFTFYHPLPWALALLGMGCRAQQRKGPLILLVLSLLWSLGDHGPLPVAHFMQALPGLNWLRYPPRASLLTLLVLSLFCADAVTWLELRLSAVGSGKVRRVLSGGLSLLLLLSAGWMLKSSQDSFGGLLEEGAWPTRAVGVEFRREVCTGSMYLAFQEGRGCVNGFTPVPLVNARSVRGVGQPDYRGELWVEDVSAEARLLSRSTGHVEARLDTPVNRGALLLNQSSFPGWYEVEGATVESRRGLTAVRLDGREHPYRLEYRSTYAALGLLVSMFTLVWGLRAPFMLWLRSIRAHFSIDKLRARQ